MEPMDLDSYGNDQIQNQDYYQANMCSESRCQSPGNYSRSDISDMDIDSDSANQIEVPAKSSSSWDIVSNSLSSILSLKNETSNTQSCGSSQTGLGSKAKNSPEKSSSSFFMQNKSWEPAATVVYGSVAFKRKKSGYGIPDGEKTFAHFPQKGLMENNAHSGDQKGVKSVKMSSREMDNKRHYSETENINKQQKNISCLSFCLRLLIFAIIVCVIGAFVACAVDLQRRRCKASRTFNKKVLEMDLESFVFGQHIACKVVTSKIEDYFYRLEPTDDLEMAQRHCKPLVLSLHGWTGVGKNYISKIISESFEYSTVSHYIIPFHFPHKAFDDKYQEQIHHWIVGNVSVCSVNIFVLDEMDKAFPGVKEGIADAVQDLTKPCHLASPTFFLLLSNSHATDINKAFLQFCEESPTKSRKHLPLEHLDTIFDTDADSEIWHSSLVKRDVIDAFIPFLPLEKKHVKQCIKRDLIAKGFSTGSQRIDKILGELSFSKFGDLELSNTGCKRVADKVDYITLEKLSEN